ncbi:Achacin/aplysianin [Biomphalaria pfeifferi]|uniref:Achacin/aplysianin n=1 Tax=Biomphalaria pfeifferi TaxID=112525 RepID=A0AAD8BKH3_BIOPF|nr:Achacin/aplysianin [Biomphalaria pfeifferi]
MFRSLMHLAVLAVAWAEIDPLEKCDRKVDLAIVGAGPSGAYFGYMMRKAGLNVEIIEYTDRVGGRHKTERLPGLENVPIDLGPIMYSDLHQRMKAIIQELELTEEDFPNGWTVPEETRYVLKGQSFTEKEIQDGAQLPYQLTKEEKDNQGRLARYYLEKLTSYTGSDMPPNIRMHLRVHLQDSRGLQYKHLYKYNLSEALDLVASKDGKELFMALSKRKGAVYKDVNAVLAFSNHFNYDSNNATRKRIQQGMEALPRTLVKKFLDESSKHKLSLNRKLDAIAGRELFDYIMRLKQTETKDGRTYEIGPEEFVCASKIVLALPASSLKIIQWEPLKSSLVSEALDSVRSVPVSTVVMTFSQRHWQDNPNKKASVLFTDESISQVVELGQSPDSRAYVLQASFAEGDRVRDLETLNLYKSAGSSQLGENQVSQELSDHIIIKLSSVFGTQFSKPLSSMGVFWTKYPQSGGQTVWKANRHYDLVKSIIEHPSIEDDVYVVGSDFAWGNLQFWTEGSLETVENVLFKYFV